MSPVYFSNTSTINQPIIQNNEDYYSQENFRRSPIKSNVLKNGDEIMERENFNSFSQNHQRNENFTNKKLTDTLTNQQWEPPSLLKVYRKLNYIVIY